MVTHEIIEGQDGQSWDRAIGILNRPDLENTSKARAKRERFLALLKSRYGYTNEKSVDEMKRLLKLFYRMNRSTGIYHSWTGCKPRNVDK